MKQKRTFTKVLFAVFVAIFVLACKAFTGSVPATAENNNDPANDTPSVPTELPQIIDTPTSEPTEAPVEPTVAPVATTQNTDEFNALLQNFADKGYIGTTDGDITLLDPFKEDWAQIGWFQHWDYDVTTTDEFVIKAHFNWSSASSTPDASGCGIVFGIQESGDYYAVFLDNKRIYFFMNRSKLYSVGKTSGKGTTGFGNPAESDFVIAVSNKKAYVSVDGDVTVYTLSQDQATQGKIGLSLLSGTNRDYGTRCEATDIAVWSAK